MPKKTTTARSGAQRNRPRVQKSFELVRQSSDEQELEPVESISEEPTPVSVSTMAPPTEVKPVEKKETPVAVSSAASTPTVSTSATSSTSSTTLTSKKSASARLAAQRQATRTQQQRAASLITAEHYAYVRRDLIFIAVLAIIMFAAIIILHFVPGIGS
jgi:hypothetical protein